MAGIDVHNDTVVASIRDARGSKVQRETRTFGTATSELIELFDWLAASSCEHVAMESTGVYWKPVWRVLEGGFELTLANAKEVKNVPGRKSDSKKVMPDPFHEAARVLTKSEGGRGSASGSAFLLDDSRG